MYYNTNINNSAARVIKSSSASFYIYNGKHFSESNNIASILYKNYQADLVFIYFVYSQLLSNFVIYEWNSKAEAAKSIRPLTKDDSNITALALLPGGKEELVFTRQSMLAPNEIWRINPQTLQETRITAFNDKFLKSFPSCKVEKKMLKADDGKDILTWLVFPPNFDPMKTYPAVLFCQGGRNLW